MYSQEQQPQSSFSDSLSISRPAPLDERRSSDTDKAPASPLTTATNPEVPVTKQVPFEYELHGQRFKDEFQWLEQLESADSLAYVARQNAYTTSHIHGATFHEIVEKLGKLNTPNDVQIPRMGEKYVVKFKSDPEHPKGRILYCSRKEFLREKEKAEFKVLLDIDELSQKEGKDWHLSSYTWKGKNLKRFIIGLSDGGGDAAVVREFDVKKKRFLKNGFQAEGLVHAEYRGKKDRILFTVPTNERNTSQARYGLEVREWNGEKDLEKSRSLYLADKSHMSVGADVWPLGDKERIVVEDHLNFFESEHYVVEKGGKQKVQLPFPKKCDIKMVYNGNVIFSPADSFHIGNVDMRGGLVWFNLQKYLETDKLEYRALYRPLENQSLEDIDEFNGRFYLHYKENLSSKLFRSCFKAKELERDRKVDLFFEEIELPGKGVVSAVRELTPKKILISYSDFVTPSTHFTLKNGETKVENVFMQQEAKFDASRVQVSQQWAISKDGTKVPFFVLDGRTDRGQPAQTILYGYGGFGVSLDPDYSWARGAGWVERGNVYVVANLRGGGEFGPAWHEAALGKNRNRAYEDCAAIADRLVQLGLTTPKQLGMLGGSNGGLLAGNMLTMYPEKFGAIMSEVPLLDMLRFDQTMRGQSWTAEYGSPQKADDLEHLKRYSPYHNIDAQKKYPPVLFTTSTADDRVDPAHARKMAARMQSMGIPDVYFYEEAAGGHGGSDFYSWIPDVAQAYSFFDKFLKK